MQEKGDTQEHDIKRMVMFIKHEAKEKAKEIKIQAIEEYNTEKAKTIKKDKDIIEKDFHKKKRVIEIDVITTISDIKAEYRMKYQKSKEKIMNVFLAGVFKVLQNKVLEKGLFEECLSFMVQQGIKDKIIVYVLERDLKNTKSWCKDKKMDLEVKIMGLEYLGGVKMVNGLGNVICDNTYLARVEMLKKRHLHEIANVIFK